MLQFNRGAHPPNAWDVPQWTGYLRPIQRPAWEPISGRSGFMNVESRCLGLFSSFGSTSSDISLDVQLPRACITVDLPGPETHKTRRGHLGPARPNIERGLPEIERRPPSLGPIASLVQGVCLPWT
jgi:hypothetical protein